MRAHVSDLISPHPLGLALPAVYHEDPVVQSFLSAFDEVLAPVFCTLDNLDAYLDPRLTPPDFLEWLGAWVGMPLDEHWPLERRRALVEAAVELYRWRGTVRGLAAQVALHTGVEPEIEESGGLVWSSRPGQAVPGTADAFVRVRIRVPDINAINAERLSTMIGAALPADVIHELVVEQVVDEQVVDQTVVDPAVEGPGVEEATVMQPVAAEPAVDEPVVVEPVVVEPVAAEQAEDEQPAEPVGAEAVVEEPAVAAEQPVAEQPVAEQAEDEQPTVDEQPDDEHPGDEA